MCGLSAVESASGGASMRDLHSEAGECDPVGASAGDRGGERLTQKGEVGMATVCEVPNCPAVARSKTCGPHIDARTAKDLKIAKDADGHGGKSCMACRRRFVESDYVLKQMKRRENIRKGGEQFGYAHVACDPPSPRLSQKAIRESEKPLLEAYTDDVAGHRGAA